MKNSLLSLSKTHTVRWGCQRGKTSISAASWTGNWRSPHQQYGVPGPVHSLSIDGLHRLSDGLHRRRHHRRRRSQLLRLHVRLPSHVPRSLKPKIMFINVVYLLILSIDKKKTLYLFVVVLLSAFVNTALNGNESIDWIWINRKIFIEMLFLIGEIKLNNRNQLIEFE